MPAVPLLPAEEVGQLTRIEMRLAEIDDADEVDEVSEFEDSLELADVRWLSFNSCDCCRL